VVIVWIGRDDNRPLDSGATGGRVAATVTRDFLDQVRDAIVLAPPPLPQGIVTVLSDPDTGLPSEGKNAVVEIVRGVATDDLPSQEIVPEDTASLPR
jgi:penicillin-binding protein 1A